MGSALLVLEQHLAGLPSPAPPRSALRCTTAVCALVCTRTDEELAELLDNLGGLDLAFFAAPSVPAALRTWAARVRGGRAGQAGGRGWCPGVV